VISLKLPQWTNEGLARPVAAKIVCYPCRELVLSMTSTPPRSGMPGHFGIRITDAKKDKLVGELDVDDRHLNNSGHVHGGALAAFADDLGGSLGNVTLDIPRPIGRMASQERRCHAIRS